MIGTLLPLSALGSQDPRGFVDWLAKTSQNVWQMLPVSPHFGASPYSTAGVGVDPEFGSFNDLMDLKDYARKRGIELWGDLPFYLDINSPLIEKYKDCFLLDSPYTAGVLKEKYFTERQEWGMPLYDYSRSKKIKLAWELWQERIKFMANFFTRVRLDSAIRFFTYEKLSSQKDEIVSGPGEEFFTKIIDYGRSCGVELFVEDVSGLNMASLYKACRKLNVATVSVFTMILLFKAKKIRPRDFRLDFGKNHVYYTSTHDTVPLAPYLQYLTPEQKEKIKSRFGSVEPLKVREFLIKKCPTLILSLQDWLLTGERINVPGEINETNWHYKIDVPVKDLPFG